jgi:hypothetical protein
MIRGDMSVTEFVITLWKNKIKVALLVLVLIFGPGLYDDWQNQRAREKLDADRRAVDTEASIAGMMLADAWTRCKEIGFVNDLERCANHKGRLLQEIAAPQLAQMAIQHRDSYWRSCQRFHPNDYCNALLTRSFQLSFAQQKNEKRD